MSQPNSLSALGQLARLTDRRHSHGFNLPLFWMKTAGSCGVGDFGDLRCAVDWCAEIRWQIIQLLPLCDTWDGTSPYSGICAFSLNWIYIDVREWLTDSERAIAQSLNAHPTVSYPQVRAFKHSVLQRITAQGKFDSETLEFTQEHSWVIKYARFCACKESFDSAAWWTWPELDEQCETFRAKEQFYATAQYLAYSQLRKVKDYAQAQGVKLKGDLPILMQRDSCDVWANPTWFNLSQEVGAPPDMYAPDGQNWGFPPCQWPSMHQSGFAWWKERLAAADLCFHLYRLDHIAGFFRLWCIPTGQLGKDGKYLPQIDDECEKWGRENLAAVLTAGKALPVGEDLGTIQPLVRRVMSDLGIPGTKIMRWERDWNQGGIYIPGAKYSACSMTSVSTHDSQTLTQWWRECRGESDEFAASRGWPWSSQLSPDRRFDILRDSHSSNSALHINLLAEYLPLFPQIAPGIEEQRINIPATRADTNWTVRSPVNFDAISKSGELLETMRQLAR